MASPSAIALPVPTDPPPEDGVLRYLGIDACVRLPLRVDAARLDAELARLPASTWSGAERDPVVLGAVESLYVVGYPRGATPRPSDDRPVLAELPYLREILRALVPAGVRRAIVARLRPQGLIPIHCDAPRHFRGVVRLSIQVAAGGVQRLYCNGLWYHFAPGEVWATDNLRPHGVYNSAVEPRINALAEFEPSDALARLIAAGDADLGVLDAPARAELEAMTHAHYRKHRWQSLRYELGKLVRRRGF
jgi:hypothetical protein